MISSQGTTIVGLRLSPSGRHYPRSQSLSEMYCSRSAGSGPAQDQKRLSFGELASAHQTDMRRVIWHDEARSLCIIERIRHGKCIKFPSKRIFRRSEEHTLNSSH